MNKKNIFVLIAELFAIFSLAQAADTPQSSAPSTVLIRQIGNRFELIRNEEPYFINGAGGAAYLDELVKAGGNSIRTWSSSEDTLDNALQRGLTVCMGLSMSSPRHGADYNDQQFLTKQRLRIRDEVTNLKDHPALLIWAIGNEVEHEADQKDCILVWKEIEVIARMIKQIDRNHPVITVVAGAGRKLEDIKQLCPTLDAIGINSYGELGKVPSMVRKFKWEKPYIITEFGPRGWWEAQRTPWGLPIEDTSTEKAKFYHDVYKAGIDNKPNCLGSYVFLWGNKQEKTHTWFNLFLPDGEPTEIVDTMTFLWTGSYPHNRAPMIGTKEIYTNDKNDSNIYKAGTEVAFKVQAIDLENDELTVKWDLRQDKSDNPAIGGDWEPRVPPIEGAVVTCQKNNATIKMPSERGNYRVFAYVYDGGQKAATVNLAIQVK